MRLQEIYILAACLSALMLTSGVSAYGNNCKGSSYSPTLENCQQGLRTVNAGASYGDQSQFSTGDCYIIYATNGAGNQPVSGQTIIDTANTILSQCSARHGSYGTNNCAECHVTINYRSPTKRDF